MAMTVNGIPRKTLYTVRVFCWSEDEKVLAQIRSMRIIASDGYPVVVEIPNISEEERNRLRTGNTGTCWFDISSQLTEEIDDGPRVITWEPVDFSLVDETGNTTHLYSAI